MPWHDLAAHFKYASSSTVVRWVNDQYLQWVKAFPELHREQGWDLVPDTFARQQWLIAVADTYPTESTDKWRTIEEALALKKAQESLHSEEVPQSTIVQPSP